MYKLMDLIKRMNPIKALAGALIWLCVLAPAMALTINGNTITLTDAESRACVQGGGCLVMPAEYLQSELARLQQEAYDAGVRETKRQCKRDGTV
jgi:hypothetical protein